MGDGWDGGREDGLSGRVAVATSPGCDTAGVSVTAASTGITSVRAAVDTGRSGGQSKCRSGDDAAGVPKPDPAVGSAVVPSEECTVWALEIEVGSAVCEVLGSGKEEVMMGWVFVGRCGRPVTNNDGGCAGIGEVGAGCR